MSNILLFCFGFLTLTLPTIHKTRTTVEARRPFARAGQMIPAKGMEEVLLRQLSQRTNGGIVLAL